MNRAGRIILIVVLFGAAGAVYYFRAGSVNDLTSRREYNARLHCLSCGHDFPAELDVGDVPPRECPKCHGKTAWFVWQCGKCGNTFTPPPGGDPPRQPMMPTCPKCQSAMTGRAAAE
ncbi:MAG: hypothetical protein HY718_06795 [Planctomycetes bacterium]|nr:hypothetical protein [Planctomycetota bacterium]